MMRRINEVAELIEALEKLPGGNPLRDDPAYKVVKERGYINVPRIVSITTTEAIHQFSDADYPRAIKRAEQGYTQTMKALGAMAQAAKLL